MNWMRWMHRRSSGAAILRKVKACLVVTGILLVVPQLWAHHGMAAFDTTHTVKMQGTVTEFQFINPHAFIYADIRDEKGKVTNWKLELGSLGMLTRYGGWSQNTLKRGDWVKVQGFKAKDGSAYFSVGLIKLPNGKTLEGKP